jgi:hypothetical protein
MLFFFKKYILKEYHKISLFIIIIASFFISIFKSIHNTDPLHFSYLFYDSTKLLEGLTPFKDIHIVYGILTTLIHSFSILIIGNFLLSISIITAFFYALTFYVYYKILCNFNLKKIYVFLAILIIFIMHPAILKPWPDYLAYFFLICSIFFYSKEKQSDYYSFLVGFLLALSVMSRFSFVLPLSVFFFLILLFEGKKKRFLIFFGYVFPLLIFFLYLNINNLYEFWYINCCKSHSIYQYNHWHPFVKEQYGYLNFFLILDGLLINLFTSIVTLDFKWFFYFLVLILNTCYLIIKIFSRKLLIKTEKKLCLLSVLSILMFSNAVHIPAIFRLSTGAIIGLVPILCFFEKLTFKNFFFSNVVRLIIFFFLIIFILKYPFRMLSAYKFILHDNLALSEPKVGILKFQRFPTDVSFFYQQFEKEINKLHSKYNIAYNYNFTNNSLLPLISKTQSYQFSSFHGHDGFLGSSAWEKAYEYRPDLSLSAKLKNKSDDIIIFQNVKNESEIFSDDFFIFSKLNYPLHKDNKILLILLSKKLK